jgi:hydroxymethylpyrimidine/phosphomethylpyrimidine kinase
MTPPIALTIAGSDCSSGAGIQADLKTFSYHHCHGLTALTCVVAETPETVVSIHPVPSCILKDQLAILLNSYPVNAIKTGMLFSEAHVIATAEILSNKTHIPLVIDPVMIATSGASLLDPQAIQAFKENLLPLATLITPNMPEAAALLEEAVESSTDLEPAAKKLSELFNTSVLLKGGHLPGNQDRLDVLWHAGKTYHFTAPKIEISCTHGTGCTLSAAITANLAHGLDLPESVTRSLLWTRSAIAHSFKWPSPKGSAIHCLNHLH